MHVKWIPLRHGLYLILLHIPTPCIFLASYELSVNICQLVSKMIIIPCLSSSSITYKNKFILLNFALAYLLYAWPCPIHTAKCKMYKFFQKNLPFTNLKNGTNNH